MKDTGLSERQRYWFDHLKAAEESGVSLVAYASQQGLKVKELYNRKSWFIKQGLMVSIGGGEGLCAHFGQMILLGVVCI